MQMPSSKGCNSPVTWWSPLPCISWSGMVSHHIPHGPSSGKTRRFTLPSPGLWNIVYRAWTHPDPDVEYLVISPRAGSWAAHLLRLRAAPGGCWRHHRVLLHHVTTDYTTGSEASCSQEAQPAAGRGGPGDPLTSLFPPLHGSASGPGNHEGSGIPATGQPPVKDIPKLRADCYGQLFGTSITFHSLSLSGTLQATS